jgi:hypothetical protein
MRAYLWTGALAASVAAVTLLGAVAPAQAAWEDQYGYWHHGPPPYVYAAPVYRPPVVVVGPPVIYAPRVWIAPHWWGYRFVPGHWR